MIGALISTAASLFVFVLGSMIYRAEHRREPAPNLGEGIGVPSLIVIVAIAVGAAGDAAIRWIIGA